MSRFRHQPSGYKPGLELSLREAAEGGDLLPAVLTSTGVQPARLETVVLVHGFNNHRGEAVEAYLGLRGCQYPRAGILPPRLEDVLADLFWPGDAAWGLLDGADFLVYPVAVDTACRAAPPLAAHLAAMPGLRLVHFVGHSLGCRVVLETVEILRAGGGPAVGKLCLMAAAVPVAKVEPGAALAAALEHAYHVRILYSEDDTVLRWAFPPGQTMASGDEGFFPTALGRYGPLPGTPGRLDPQPIPGARHGDYWGHSGKPPAKTAADRVGEFLREEFRGSTAAPRGIASRPACAAARPASAEPREVSFARDIQAG